MKKQSMVVMSLILFVSTLILAPAFAAEQVKVSVKGMVCAYCSTGVEKSFNKQKAVETVKVDLDAHLVHLTFKDQETMSDELITEVVTKSGLNVETIERLKN